VVFDIGVTEEPCPGGSADRGCIYVGAVTDESGPFAAASPALVGGQKAFWAVTNATGGIGGEFDVALPDEYVKDGQYRPDVTVTEYTSIADSVAALAMLLGTPQGLATLDSLEADNTIAAPMSWWSGWGFEEQDRGLIYEFGTPYCYEGMNAMDWAAGAAGAGPGVSVETVGILKFDSDYGNDYAEGVKEAAAANGVTVAWEEIIVAVAAGGDPTQVAAVTKLVTDPVDVVFVVSGPNELAPIVGGGIQQGYTGLFIGSAPSWSPALLDTAAGPAFEVGTYFQSSFVGPWDYESAGHGALRAALPDVPGNFFFVAGWMSQYALKAAFDAAYASGDMTKAGIAAAAQQLSTVDYQGMATARPFTGDPNDIVTRDSLIGRVDTSTTDGISVIEDFFIGPTATAHTHSEPCAAP
jgi:ABC-type branched-subunit amino acid transport system substrate-binding protein